MESYLPSQLFSASRRLSDYRVNTFKLETQSASTASPGSTVTVNLPENALIDTRSFRMFFKVVCDGATVNTSLACGLLPEHANGLISRVEWYANGQQLSQGSSEHNTIFMLARAGKVSRDKDGAYDRALQHSSIIDPASNSNESAYLVISDWSTTFIGSCPRFLDTGLIGQLTCKITFAPASVLVPRLREGGTERAVGYGFGATADSVSAASQITYQASDIFFDIKTVHVGPQYAMMLRGRLENDGVISLPYTEWYSFSQDGIAGTNPTHRFSLSSRSLNRLLATFRSENYNTVGVKGHDIQSSVAFADRLVSNYFNFISCDDDNFSAKYSWTVNNVQYGQYQQDYRAALSDLEHTFDKVHCGSSGGLITSMESFKNGHFVLPLTLCMSAEQDVQLSSGLDSRGVNTMMTLRFTGLTLPTVSAAGQVASSRVNSFIAAETTAVLHIKAGRVCVPEF